MAVGKGEFDSFSLVLVLYLHIKSTESVSMAEDFCWAIVMAAVKKEQTQCGVQREQVNTRPSVTDRGGAFKS